MSSKNLCSVFQAQSPSGSICMLLARRLSEPAGLLRWTKTTPGERASSRVESAPVTRPPRSALVLRLRFIRDVLRPFLGKRVVAVLRNVGYERPTPIQAATARTCPVPHAQLEGLRRGTHVPQRSVVHWTCRSRIACTIAASHQLTRGEREFLAWSVLRLR